jgi:hypothetical protein
VQYANGTTLKTLKSIDGMRCVDIVVRNDGRFQFFEYYETTDDGYTYWAPGWISGQYESAEDTESAARVEIPWLRAVVPSGT